LKSPHAKAGFLSILVSCEIDQAGLQKLLYDLEAGMPFLFVDQLAVQAATSASGSGSGKLRTLLAVSGQWQETK
jgi:general secretion pathway protein M